MTGRMMAKKMKISKRNKYDSPAYWTQLIQLSLQESIKHYLEEHGMTRSEFAERLGVSKGYVSQILNGDFDHKLSKLTQLALACDMVPRIEFVPKVHSRQVAHSAYLQPTDWKYANRYMGDIVLRTLPTEKAKFTAISGVAPVRYSSPIVPDDKGWPTVNNLVIPDNKIA